MVHVSLDTVSVDFPIYGGTSRSLKNSLVHVGTGGRLATGAGDRKFVNALRNVSLEVREGDRVGLIGGNGAGKTTLLRVMAGIYEPTKGVCTSAGNIVPLFGGSLGMDLELPGYDNIVLRGRILGLSQKQIKAQVDDIADFAELDHFLYLPVRTYSAGMRLRLAFAITTAIEADILLLDEGVGAGDEAFRRKVGERVDSFIARAGLLVLATHSVSLMTRFCDRALWLDHGEVKAFGPIDQVLGEYRASVLTPEQIALMQATTRAKQAALEEIRAQRREEREARRAEKREARRKERAEAKNKAREERRAKAAAKKSETTP
jgi:ABC-2 type transport system ATP-binding protein/lipopolysaccharide transport system ATP-binding protein